MCGQFAVYGELPEPHRDIARCRYEATVTEAKPQQQLPNRQQPDRRGKVEQPFLELRRRLAHASISALLRVTSSSRIRQIASFMMPNSAAADSSITLRGRRNGISMIFLMRPGCAVITTVRSPSNRASSMEWVT